MANNYYVQGANDMSQTASYSAGALPSSGDNMYFTLGGPITNWQGMNANAGTNLLGCYDTAGFVGPLGTSGSQ